MSDPNLHIVSLSFDDGLEKSNLKIAEIYESFGFSACFNVIALGHDLGFESPDPYHEGYPKGNFGLWNELLARGHEIMPHGLLHHNLAEMPLAEAQRNILHCLEIIFLLIPRFPTMKIPVVHFRIQLNRHRIIFNRFVAAME